MSLKQTIQDDLKAAMLSGDRFVADTLSNLKASILNEEVATGKRDEGLGDEAVEKVIAREVKRRAESAKLYRDNDRVDLAEVEERESVILERYLPEQASEDDIRTAVDEAIAATGADGPRAMGQVIGAVKTKLGSSADGATVARIAKEQLTK